MTMIGEADAWLDLIPAAGLGEVTIVDDMNQAQFYYRNHLCNF